MRHRRLTGTVLLLGASLPLVAGRLYGQRWDTPSAAAPREIIATSVPVSSETQAAPAAPQPRTPPQPVVPAVVAPAPETIQQVSFIANPSPSAPTAERPTPMLPPTVALGDRPANNTATTPPMSRAETMAAAVSVEVVRPDRLLLGQSLAYDIVLRNSGAQPIAEVHVEQPLPAGARVVKTEPPAATRVNRLTWDLRDLEIGGERRLKVELQPAAAGELDLRPSITFISGNGLRTKVARPPFSIEMSADHDKVPRGGHIRFTIRVSNHGDAPIQNIELHDQLPPGLYHPKGSKIGIPHFGDLLPEQTKTITLETTTMESGTFRNEVRAHADRGVEAKAALDVIVTEPSLSLRVEGPKQTVTQRDVDFQVEVANPGALAAHNVRLVQVLPPTFEVISFSTGARLDSNQHALVWSLPDLSAGQRQTVTFRCKANAAGDWPLCTSVLSQNLAETRVNRTLRAESAAALKLQVRAREERLSVGEETVLRMHVFNKGDAVCAGLRLTATLPEAVTLLEAQGPTAGQVEKQQVSFAPLAQLDAHGDAVYRLHVRGKQAGKGSLRVELTAEKQPPAVNEISIQVNGKAPVDAAAGHTNSAPSESLR